MLRGNRRKQRTCRWKAEASAATAMRRGVGSWVGGGGKGEMKEGMADDKGTLGLNAATPIVIGEESGAGAPTKMPPSSSGANRIIAELSGKSAAPAGSNPAAGQETPASKAGPSNPGKGLEGQSHPGEVGRGGGGVLYAVLLSGTLLLTNCTRPTLISILRVRGRSRPVSQQPRWIR